MRYRALLIVLLLALLMGACTQKTSPAAKSAAASTFTPTAKPTPSPTPAPTALPQYTAAPQPTPFTLYFFSDTQVYSYLQPAVFCAMTDWMLQNYEKDNALYALHAGDTVDNYLQERFWDNADLALAPLQGKLPLLCVAGNHDVGMGAMKYDAWKERDYLSVKNKLQLYRDGECFYEPFTAGGTDFLVLGIGWQKDESWVPFARRVLEKYNDRVCIILVHSFINSSGVLTEMGTTVERELIRPYTGVRLVLCGHCCGAGLWTGSYEDGARTVNGMLYDYQDDFAKGRGYLRILRFDPLTRSIEATTYSPYLDDYNYYNDARSSREQFTLYNAF